MFPSAHDTIVDSIKGGARRLRYRTLAKICSYSRYYVVPLLLLGFTWRKRFSLLQFWGLAVLGLCVRVLVCLSVCLFVGQLVSVCLMVSLSGTHIHHTYIWHPYFFSLTLSLTLSFSLPRAFLFSSSCSLSLTPLFPSFSVSLFWLAVKWRAANYRA